MTHPPPPPPATRAFLITVFITTFNTFSTAFFIDVLHYFLHGVPFMLFVIVFISLPRSFFVSLLRFCHVPPKCLPHKRGRFPSCTFCIEATSNLHCAPFLRVMYIIPIIAASLFPARVKHDTKDKASNRAKPKLSRCMLGKRVTHNHSKPTCTSHIPVRFDTLSMSFRNIPAE